MEHKLTKLKQLKQITLNDEERNLMRAHAARIVMSAPVLVTDSFFKRGVQHGLRIALSSLLFVIFIGGTLSTLADSALPGDALYGFKRNVNEEVKGLFLKTPEEKVVWQKSRIEARVNEIQTLAESNSLTPAKQQIAEDAINSHVAALSTDLTTLSIQAPNTALTVTASLEQTLKANKTAIQNTSSVDTHDTGKADAIKTVDATLQKVSNQEVQIISNEIDTINTAVTSTSTTASAALQDTPATTQSPATATPSVKPLTPTAP